MSAKNYILGNNSILLNMHGDNTEENISKYNLNLCQFTGIYYIGKHLYEFPNLDYIGIAHYHRILQFNKEQLNNNCIIQNYEPYFYMTVISQFKNAHLNAYKKFLAVQNQYFKIISEEDKLLFNIFLNEKKLYSKNIFIMPIEIFKKYFKQLEKIINIIINLNDLNDSSRDYGFILQRFSAFLIYKFQHNNISIIQKLYKEI